MKDNPDEYYRYYACSPLQPHNLLWQCKKISFVQKNKVPMDGKVVALFSIFPESSDIYNLPKQLSVQYVTIIK
jgi:hypothetical protein